MSMFNEETIFIKPAKPFVLLCKDIEGHDVVFWFETEEELIWTAKIIELWNHITHLKLDQKENYLKNFG